MARRLHALAGLGTAAHQSLELAAGTGVIGAGALGLPGAVTASVALDATWIVAARRRNPPERLLAVLSGIAIGVPILHFTLWPWKRQRGLPVLTDAEGLPQELLPAYNALLYLWAVAGAAALAKETPRRHRWIGAASTVGVVLSRPLVRRHFDWMAENARTHPTWWNRAWHTASG